MASARGMPRFSLSLGHPHLAIQPLPEHCGAHSLELFVVTCGIWWRTDVAPWRAIGDDLRCVLNGEVTRTMLWACSENSDDEANSFGEEISTMFAQ